MKELFIVAIITLGAYLLKMYGQKSTQEKQLNNAKIPEAVKQWYDQIEKAAVWYGVPSDIVAAVLWTESAGDPNARGSAGEYGLMQLKDIAIRDLQLNGFGEFSQYKTNPETNIEAGAAYLARWYKVTNSWPAAIKAYNQGLKGSKENPELAAAYLGKVNEKRKFFG